MKKILIINYYWPPSGGAVVQRWFYITKYLEELGVECFVVTIDEAVATFPNIDRAMAAEVSPTIKVFRTGTSEILQYYKKVQADSTANNVTVNNDQLDWKAKVARFIRGNFFLPDARRGWHAHAYRKAKELINKYDISHFVTVGPPHSTHLAGLKLRRAFPQKTWIVDMHDYWIGHFNLPIFYRTRLANYFDKRLEEKVTHQSDFIMVHCRSAKRKLLSRYPNLKEDKVHIHTMGYNEELFTPPNTRRQSNAFTVAYTGSLNSNYHPEVFFRALKRCIDHFAGKRNIVFKFAGTLAASIQQYIADIGLSNHFDHLGYVPHEQVINILCNSDALLLVNPKDKDDKAIIPGKLYEYLAAGKPIISIASHGSENEELILENKAGKNFERQEEEALLKFLIDLVEGQFKREDRNEEGIKKYSRKEETRVLFECIIFNRSYA